MRASHNAKRRWVITEGREWKLIRTNMESERGRRTEIVCERKGEEQCEKEKRNRWLRRETERGCKRGNTVGPKCNEKTKTGKNNDSKRYFRKKERNEKGR